MHEEASSSSTTPSTKNIIYGGTSATFNGNLLITTSQLPDASSSLYELIHQPAAPMNHPMSSSSSKLILSNSHPLISTTTNPSSLLDEEFNAVASSSGPAGIPPTELHDLADPNLLDDSTSDAVAAAAALIDLHPSSSSSIAGIAVPELATATSSSGSGSCSGSVEGPLEIKIPSGAAVGGDEGGQAAEYAEGSSDGGYHENISQTQSNYLAAIPPSELCPVCGDKVSGYHYGLLTCESCKGFFKRTVQNKKVYTCVAERQCHIDKTQRKRCPYCRFQKCLEVGMKLEAVRADRMRGGRNKFGPMYKRDRARKLQIMRQRQLAIQALRGTIGGGVGIGQLGGTGGTAADGTSAAAAAAAAAAGLGALDYHQSPYSSMHIKQEIQIPQVSSLTSSPDSSPSPIAIALGQVNPQTTISLSSGVGGNGSSGGGGSSGAGGGGTGAGGNGGAGSGGAGTNGGSNSNSTSAAIQSQLSESKLWMSANSTTASPHSLSPKTFSFDSGTNPTSTADNPADTLRVSPMIRDFVQSIDGDDREWTASLFSLLQNQSYNQCEVDLFELMCKVLDQNLFSQVDWARNTIFFKDLKVDDQMKLLQNSWSDMLVLDHIHQRLHNALPDETTLHNGQKFDLLGLGLLGVPSLAEHFNELQNKLQELKFDVGDYICMKFLLLLNPGKGDVRGITNRKTVIEGYENVQAALLDYTLTCYPSVPDKFAKLLSIIPEIHVIAARGEEHLYIKHCAGSAPSQTLLMEMLHAKRK